VLTSVIFPRSRLFRGTTCFTGCSIGKICPLAAGLDTLATARRPVYDVEMGRTYDGLDDDLTAFLRAQHVFFVATAPERGGHVNVSPKGLDTFAVVDSRTVAYLDLTGSGIETIAHVRQNGRITLLFSAFEGPPRIVRLYGTGRVMTVGDPDYAAAAARFRSYSNARAVIEVQLDRIADSCGYGVPRYRYEGERSQLLDWANRKGPEGILQYRAERNVESIDGLPGLPVRPR
jgi:hypothetical protein